VLPVESEPRAGVLARRSVVANGKKIWSARLLTSRQIAENALP